MRAGSRSATVVAALPVVVLASGGCLSPVAAAHDRVYLGVYTVDSRQLSPSVEYRQITGLGLSVGRSGLGFGWSDRRAVVAEPAEDGCVVVTPLCELATGRAAEASAIHFAASQDLEGRDP